MRVEDMGFEPEAAERGVGNGVNYVISVRIEDI